MIIIILQMKKEETDTNYDPSNLFNEGPKYNEWYKKDKEKSISQPEETIAERIKLTKEKADDKYLSQMPALEGDKKVKQEKELKVLIPSKLLIRFPLLLA